MRGILVTVAVALVTLASTGGAVGATKSVEIRKAPSRLTIKGFLRSGIKFTVHYEAECDTEAFVFVLKGNAKRLHLSNKEYVLAIDDDHAPGGPYTVKGTLFAKKGVARKIKGYKRIPAYLAVTCGDDYDSSKVTLTG